MQQHNNPNQQQRLSILALPDDVLSRVFLHLDDPGSEDRFSHRLVCRRFRDLLPPYTRMHASLLALSDGPGEGDAQEVVAFLEKLRALPPGGVQVLQLEARANWTLNPERDFLSIEGSDQVYAANAMAANYAAASVLHACGGSLLALTAAVQPYFNSCAYQAIASCTRLRSLVLRFSKGEDNACETGQVSCGCLTALTALTSLTLEGGYLGYSLPVLPSVRRLLVSAGYSAGHVWYVEQVCPPPSLGPEDSTLDIAPNVEELRIYAVAPNDFFSKPGDSHGFPERLLPLQRLQRATITFFSAFDDSESVNALPLTALRALTSLELRRYGHADSQSPIVRCLGELLQQMGWLRRLALANGVRCAPIHEGVAAAARARGVDVDLGGAIEVHEGERDAAVEAAAEEAAAVEAQEWP